jgi:predicted nucleic acid-binding protein
MCPSVVLDTNVLLDWFVFDNPGVQALRTSIEGGRCRWLGCAAMRDELAHVLMKGPLKPPAERIERALTSWDRLCLKVDPPGALPAHRLRCSDGSDQVFIDLALTHGADWLFTRDRALLKLARRARAQGLQVAVPEAWPG